MEDNVKTPVTIRVEMLDGSEQSFLMNYGSEDGPDYSLGSKLQKLLNLSNLAFHVDDELLIIPMQQVKSIHVSPIQTKLPEGVVAHVTRHGLKASHRASDRHEAA